MGHVLEVTRTAEGGIKHTPVTHKQSILQQRQVGNSNEKGDILFASSGRPDCENLLAEAEYKRCMYCVDRLDVLA